jgi:hypothetical protein
MSHANWTGTALVLAWIAAALIGGQTILNITIVFFALGLIVFGLVRFIKWAWEYDDES